MKKIFGVVVIVTLFLSANAQTMLEKGQSGVALAGTLTLDPYNEGLAFGVGYTFDGIFDLGVIGGRNYAKSNEGHFNSDIYENYWGLECAVWFLNKEISSEATFRSGLLGGASFGKLNENAWIHYSAVKSVQGFGGLELLLNYNPGNDFFHFQPYVNAVYSEGKVKYFVGDNISSSYSAKNWIFSAGVSFGFRFSSGDAFSLSISKSFVKEADNSILGIGIQYEIPTEN